MPIIQAQALTKCFRVAVKEPGFRGALKHLFRPRFEEKVAVDRIDLSVAAGERVAYIGPNGAGKSTTVKMLAGILVPTSGSLRVNGLVPHENRIENARGIGVVFGQRTQLWWDLPVREAYRLLGDIYRVPQDVFHQQLTWAVEELRLEPLLGRPVRTLSLGQRMLCDVAAALLHRPPLLFLDEPTIGLDVTVKERLRAFIRASAARHGTTLVLTSHDTEDIEALCERVVIIDRGAVLFDGSRTAMVRRFGRRCTLHLVLAEPGERSEDDCRAALAGAPPTVIHRVDETRVEVHFDLDTASSALLLSRLLPRVPVKDIRIEEMNLQTVISQAYRGDLQLDERRTPA